MVQLRAGRPLRKVGGETEAAILLIVVRVLAAATAVGTAVPVATGAMADPIFAAADLVLAGLLLLAAVWRGRWAAPLLAAGNAYALGVFSVALASRLQPGATINPLLVGVMAVCGLSLILLAVRMRG